MPSRRSLLTGLLATVAAPRIYVLPPLGGWRLRDGLWASNGHGSACWRTKTPEEILADFNVALRSVALDDNALTFVPAQLELLDKAVAEKLWYARNRRWFL